MPNFIKVLVESENFKVESKYETVTLRFKNQPNFVVTIGDFYGDPVCALIAANEKYVVTGGCGLIIYHIREPFLPYQYGMNVPQYQEFFRDPESILWIETIYQSDMDNLEGNWTVFKFVTLNEEGEKIYRMDSVTGEISSI